MSGRLLSIEEILTILEDTPRRLAELTEGLTPSQLRAAPNENEWSANEVLAHLRACADVWGECIAAIVAEDKPALRAINPRTWIKRTNYPDLEFDPSLRAFAAQRVGLSATLRPLAPEDWSRAATVAGAGKLLQRTAHLYAQWQAKHERPHVKQIQRIVNAARG